MRPRFLAEALLTVGDDVGEQRGMHHATAPRDVSSRGMSVVPVVPHVQRHRSCIPPGRLRNSSMCSLKSRTRLP